MGVCSSVLLCITQFILFLLMLFLSVLRLNVHFISSFLSNKKGYSSTAYEMLAYVIIFHYTL